MPPATVGSPSDIDACVAVDAIATPWHALRAVARLDPTDTLVVIGAGAE